MYIHFDIYIYKYICTRDIHAYGTHMGAHKDMCMYIHAYINHYILFVYTYIFIYM